MRHASAEEIVEFDTLVQKAILCLRGSSLAYLLGVFRIVESLAIMKDINPTEIMPAFLLKEFRDRGYPRIGYPDEPQNFTKKDTEEVKENKV